jgi:hypothetical protein
MRKRGGLGRQATTSSVFWTQHVGRKAVLQFFAGVVLLFSLTGTHRA